MSQLSFSLGEVRHNWQRSEVKALFELPFNDLIFHAHSVHRQHFNPNQVQISTLLSIKTGACPEDCAYCPQSGHYDTGLEKEKLFDIEDVVEKAKQAKANGATRFCMGAGWRNPPEKAMPALKDMVERVKALGLETCLTAGMLSQQQAESFKASGLDYYNHNIDTSPDYYKEIITTRTFEDRIDTLKEVRDAGIKVCCGGIMGLGETEVDRFEFLMALSNLPEHPESVPINKLIPIPGTPLANEKPLDPLDFVRVIALARIMMPTSFVRLSAGRQDMSDEMHAMCFFAGANSIHYGEKLLTTELPDQDRDKQLLERLQLNAYVPEGYTADPAACAK